ncbi:hypothetical protein FOA52_014263 [Chlamydomonas sp. UWO 241]|nr:hypothetical protein FOA52_014263 [Chlamydomonas sp. UWO 241]
MASGSLLGVVELSVSLKSFVNIQLHAQGYYSLRFRIPATPGIKVVWPASVTYGVDDVPPLEGVPLREDWCIDGRGFRSRIFTIQFCHEQVALSEVFTFHLFVDRLKDLDQLSCKLHVDLLFFEVDLASKPDYVPTNLHLKPVARETLRLLHPAAGAQRHYSVTFNAMHFGLVNLAVLASLGGFTTKLALKRALSSAPEMSNFMSASSMLRPMSSRLLGQLGSSRDARHSPGHSAVTDAALGMASLGRPLLQTGGPEAAAALTAALADAISGPWCLGPSSSSSASSAASEDVPASRQQLDELSSLHTLIVGHLTASTQLLAAFLHGLPPECWPMQSYAGVKRMMVATLALAEPPQAATGGAAGGATGSGAGAGAGEVLNPLAAIPPLPESTASGGKHGGGNAGNATDVLPQLPLPALPPLHTGRGAGAVSSSGAGAGAGAAAAAQGRVHTSSKPTPASAQLSHQSPAPSPASRLRALAPGAKAHAAVGALVCDVASAQREARVEGLVLAFVLRACDTELHRVLKAEFDSERAGIVAAWLSLNPLGDTPDGSHAASVDKALKAALLSAAADVRRGIAARGTPQNVARLHGETFWDNASGLPVLQIDDSLAAHLPDYSARQSKESARESPGPGPGTGTWSPTPPGTPTGTPRNSAPPHLGPARGRLSTGGTSSSHASEPKAKPLAPSALNGLAAPQPVHFVVFVHGYQGHSSDMSLIKGHLSLIYPHLECFSSKVNEGATSDSIETMGARLAAEVAAQLRPHVRSRRRPLAALSFVGHSIGNLILRSALTCSELAPYVSKLHLYVSVSGPHLGYLFSSNAVLDAAVGLLKHTGKAKCLHELCFTDAPVLTDCYLYKLAMGCQLSRFKTVLLLASQQDGYVPLHSARVSMCPKATAAHDDTTIRRRHGAAYVAMVKALTRGLGDPGKAQLLRIDVDFDYATRGFSLGGWINAKIGRRAHIEFIESPPFAFFLAWAVHRYRLLPESDAGIVAWLP